MIIIEPYKVIINGTIIFTIIKFDKWWLIWDLIYLPLIEGIYLA